jgi:hypothetical protein
MGAQEEGNGLTLEGLALRLETLERENERMRSENDALQSKVATLEGSQMPPGDDEEPARALDLDGRVSRRRLLSKAGVAAAGLVVAGALTQRDIREAKAAQLIGTVDMDSRGAVEGINTNSFGIGVYGDCPRNIGVKGSAMGTNGMGVFGEGVRYGIRGESNNGNGVSGTSWVTGHGVHGSSGSGHGVLGEGNGTAETAGVRGTGKTGVWGSTGVTGYSGVYGQHTGSFGYGLVGDGRGSSGAGVLGRNNDSSGVRGEGVNGVQGKATSGYGGLFEGGKAQLKIVPKGSVGKPTSGAHTKGEVYMDSAGALFVCMAGGTPGTWRKVTTTAA